MSKAGYSAVSGGAVALSPATAKTILGVLAPAQFGLDLIYGEVGFDGSSFVTPVLVELCAVTFATNPPGTNSTSITPTQDYGRAVAHGVTAAKTWTTEPTVLTVIDEALITPTGFVKWAYPLGQSPDCDVSKGFALRCTAPAAVNVRGTLRWERC